MADTTTAHAAAIHGHIAARIDRLPLHPGPVASRHPGGGHLGLHHLRHRRNRGAAVSLRLAAQPHHRRLPVCRDPGAAGRRRHSAGRLPDELGRRPYGRRPAILLATLLGGICIWPFAYVTNFWGMVVLSVLSTLGVGGIVATHSVYLSEMTSPLVRNRVLLASQGVTALVAVGVNLLAFWLIPSQWQAFLWISAIIEIVVLLPLALLEAAGIAALAGGARPARGSRTCHGGIRTPGAAVQQRSAAGRREPADIRW